MENDHCAACQFAYNAGITGDLYHSDVEYRSDLSTDYDSEEESDPEPASDEAGAGETDLGAEPIHDERLPGVSDDVLDEAALIEEIWASDDEADDEGKEYGSGVTSQSHDGRRRVRRSAVRMPTGKRFNIPTPRPKYWKCNNKSNLITLRRYGRTKKEYIIIKKEMEKTKAHHPGYEFDKYRIIRIQKVINGCLWRQFRHIQDEIKREVGYVNQRMLFHGSTVVDNIVHNGFNEQYSRTTGMFGAGLYFAKHSSKANQYVFSSAKAGGCPTHLDMNCMRCDRKMLLCRVILGKTKNEKTLCHYAHPPVGHNSVTGVPSKDKGGLRYPEYVVYKREQVYPEYLITYKISD